MHVSFSIIAPLQSEQIIQPYECFCISLEEGLPADSRYKPGCQQGSPTGRYTEAGQSTEDTERDVAENS